MRPAARSASETRSFVPSLFYYLHLCIHPHPVAINFSFLRPLVIAELEVDSPLSHPHLRALRIQGGTLD